MNGRRREKFTGIYPGPYAVGNATKSDIPVTAEGPEGPIVVGRFSITKSTDAEAQARAYAALPEILTFLREIARHSDSFGSEALAILATAGADA